MFPLPSPLLAVASDGGPITVGNTVARSTVIATGANNQIGGAWQITQAGQLNYITIVGHTSISNNVNFRLCIYAATSQTVWGALLAQTAQQTSLAANEVKKVPLITPINVNVGDWVAITVQTAASMPAGASPNGGERFFPDTYSDGAASTASATDAFSSGNHCIYASTL